MSAASDAYLQAIRTGNRRAAFGVLDDALDQGAELSTLYLEVVQPAMREIGDSGRTMRSRWPRSISPRRSRSRR